MDQFRHYLKCEDESIEELQELIPQQIKRRERNLAADNALSLCVAHIQRGLLLWRTQNSPRPDFEAACDALDHMKAYADSDVVVGLGNTWLYVHGIRNLIDRASDYEVSADDRRDCAMPMMELYVVQSARDHVADWLETAIVEHMRNEGGLYQKSLTTYRRLFGAEDHNESIDELVRQAEKNWVARKGSKQFSDTFSVFGDGLDNEVYVDWMLAVVLKKIDWSGNSIHKWRW